MNIQGERTFVKMEYDNESKLDIVPEKQHLSEFIELWESLPELWDTSIDAYRNKIKKNMALDQLLVIYNKIKPGSTRADVKKKLNSLRTNFRKEVRKVMESKYTAYAGDGTDGIYVPTNWTYHKLLFLSKHDDQAEEQLKRDSENTDAEDNKLMYITSQLDPLEMPTSIEIRNKKRRRTDQNTSKERTFLELSDHDDSENQEEYHLARLWASKLRKLAPIQKLLAEKAVNDILFEAALGNLNHSSVKINEPIRSKSPSPTESKAPTVYFIPSSDKSPSRRYYKTSSNPSAGTSNHVDFSN